MKCQDCGFVFASPRPSLDDIKKSYSEDSFYDSWLSEDKGRLRMWTKRVARVAQILRKTDRVLDYSAGVGTFLSILKQRGCEVFGTELSTSAIRIAREKHGIRLESESQFDSREFHQFFDVITAWHVVEHVESPSKLLKQFHGLLNAGGRLVVAVPNVNHRHIKSNWFKPDFAVLFPPMVPGNEIHLSHFSPKTLTRLLEKSNFRIIVSGIDDYSPVHDLRTRFQYWLYSLILGLGGCNVASTIYVVAEKI